MLAKLWNYAKKVNSTSQPDGGAEVEMTMRSGFDINNPQLEYRRGNLNFNYMYIPDTGRYYYINEARYNAEENFFLVTGEVDVLATWRNAILNSYQYVLRYSGSDDVTIFDPENAVIAQPVVRAARLADFPFTITNGFADSCVVINLAGSGHLCMTGHNYNLLMRNFTHRSDPWNFGEYFTVDIARNLNNPLSYINNVIAFPIQAYGGSTGKPVMAYTDDPFAPIFGWYRVTDVTAYHARLQFESFEQTIGVGSHPQAVSQNDYLNFPPYFSCSLYVAGIGLVGIDTSKLTGGENLRVQTTIDYTTGAIIIRVKKENGAGVVGYGTGQIGYPLSTAQAHSADMIGAIGGTLMGSVMGGAVGGVGGAVIGGASSLSGQLNSLGTNSGLAVHGSVGGAGAWRDPSGTFMALLSEYKRVRKPPAEVEGLPYNRGVTLSTCAGGYIKCATGDVSCTGNEAQKQKIKSFLLGGVYLE